MKIGRTIPPAASPISIYDILSGISSVNNSGKAVKKFQKSIKEYFRVKHCFLLSSGKAAISVSLKALSILFPHRKRVIIPAFNCYSVPSAIIKAGFDVYPCDINSRTLQLEPQSLQKAITISDDVLAIIPAHLFGLPAPIPIITQMARNAGIPVIEDAAQVMGSRINGILLGTQADLGIFSLSRGKAFSTCEGGIIITSRDDIGSILSDLVKLLPKYSYFRIFCLLLQSISLCLFIRPWLFWLPKALPSFKIGETVFDNDFFIGQMSDFQAGTALNWKNKLHKFLKERSIRNRFYSKHLSGIKGIVQVSNLFPITDLTGIRYPLLINNTEQTNNILDISNKYGLGVVKTYPDIINNISRLNIPSGHQCKNAQSILNNFITLPTHPLVNYEDMRLIVHTIKSIVKI